MCLYEKPCPDSSDSSALFSDSSDLFPDIFDNYVSSVLCLESFIPSSDNSASSDSYVLWFEVGSFFSPDSPESLNLLSKPRPA